MVIIPCQKGDEYLIAQAVVMAIGPELSRKYAGEVGSLEEVTRIFADVAALDFSQYSWTNASCAIEDNDDGKSHQPLGILVAYDGGRLKELRRAFLNQTGLKEGDIPDETEPGEWYVDTLAVFPEHRGRGVARALLKDAIRRGQSCGLRPGLLVEKDNHKARRLYESVGFRKIGEKEFAGEMMDHMVIEQK